MSFVSDEVRYVTFLLADKSTKSFDLEVLKDKQAVYKLVNNGVRSDKIIGWTCHQNEDDDLFAVESDLTVPTETEDNNLKTPEDEIDSILGLCSEDNEKNEGPAIGVEDSVVDLVCGNQSIDYKTTAKSDPFAGAGIVNANSNNSVRGEVIERPKKVLKTAGGDAVSNEGKIDGSDGGKNENEDDDEDLLLQEGIFNSLDSILVGESTSSTKSLDVFVSHILTNESADKAYHLVMFGDTYPVWYIKADVVMKWFKHKCKIVEKRETEPWMETLHEINIRRKEHGIDTLYKRRAGTKENPKGALHGRIMYVVPIPLSEISKAHEYVNHTLNELKAFFSLRRKNGAGAFLFRWAQDHTPNMIEKGFRSTNGNTKKGKTDVQIVRTLNKEFHEVFNRPMNLRFHTHLDKYLVDNDIKTFLIDFFDANSWDDVPEEVKKSIYKDYPNKRRTLPVWNEIEQESYR